MNWTHCGSTSWPIPRQSVKCAPSAGRPFDGFYFSLASRLWLCPTPAEQHDGGDALRVPHVHGRHRLKLCPHSPEMTSLTLRTHTHTHITYKLRLHLKRRSFFNLTWRSISCWQVQSCDVCLPWSHDQSLTFLLIRPQRSSCRRTMMPRPTCGASAPLSSSVWVARLPSRWAGPASSRRRERLLALAVSNIG